MMSASHISVQHHFSSAWVQFLFYIKTQEGRLRGQNGAVCAPPHRNPVGPYMQYIALRSTVNCTILHVGIPTLSESRRRDPVSGNWESSGSRISEPGFRQYGAPYPVPPDNIRYSVFGLWGLVCRSKGLAPWAMQVDVNSENLQHGQLRC